MLRFSCEKALLQSAVNTVSRAVAAKSSIPALEGILVEGSDRLTMVAVDGFRLALRREPLERIDGGAFRFVAPGAALNEVEKICADTDALLTVVQGKRHLLFEV